MVADQPQEERLKTAIRKFFQGSRLRPVVRRLESIFPSGARIFAAGGILRNILIRHIHGLYPPAHDIDLFIGNLPPDADLPGLFSGEDFEIAELGGIRWRPVGSGWIVDLCRIEDFVIIRQHHLDPTPEGLLAAIDFDVNAVTYELGGETLRETGCVRAIQKRTIGFNSHLFFNKAHLGYRVLLIQHRINFRVSENVFNFLKSAIDVETLRSIRSIMRSKLDPNLADRLIESFDTICLYRTYARYLDGYG